MAGWGTIFNNTIHSMRQRLMEMARLQEQAASGNRVNRASDDPGDAFRIQTLATQKKEYATFVENLHTVGYNFNYASTNLQTISGNLAEAMAMLTQAASATYSVDNRKAAGNALDEMLKSMITNANANSMGRYVFGGSRSNAAPYEAVYDDNGKLVEVNYAGSAERMMVPVAPGVESPGTLVGDEIFRLNDRKDPVFTGTTGAAPGNGTASVRGDIWLNVSHTVTNLTAPAHGIAAGASSAAGDTILGSHELKVNASDNTVQLDGGPLVAFGSLADVSDVKVTNGNGDVFYVDLTTWDGSTATVSLEAEGALSIDPETSPVAIDFTNANQAITDAEGKVLYVDSTGIARTGAEAVRNSGTYDLFSTLIEIRDLMLNTDDLDHETQSYRLTEAIKPLDEVMGGINESLTSVGGRIQAMEALQTTMEDLEFSSHEQKSSIEQADIAQVAVDINRNQTFYEMTLASASKLLNMSLLDFI